MSLSKIFPITTLSDTRPLTVVTHENTESLRTLDSSHLFKGERLIKISHQGSEYLLRITRAGKLILTK